MKVLILGGTVFVGRHLVEAALQRGHEVTLFHRGVHQADFSAPIEQLQGDRRGDLAALQGRQWDVVIDTNGYVPSVVKASAQLLAESARQYIFISSSSVYSDCSVLNIDESGPVETLMPEQVQAAEQLVPATDAVIAFTYGSGYGPLKALCEQTLEATMPGRVLSIRAGLIVGPYDYSDRFTYWPTRIARGGEVLAPGRPKRPIQLIDVRDLAAWTIRMAENEQMGIYNAVSPASALSMQHFLDTCNSVGSNHASFTWINDSFLLEHGAEPWSEIPLWLPENDESMRGFFSFNVQKALAAGLTFRPLAETISATLAWDTQRPASIKRRAGLDPSKEAHLLQQWHNS